MQNDEGYVTYNFTWFGCLSIVIGCVVLWSLAVYSGYHLAAFMVRLFDWLLG